MSQEEVKTRMHLARLNGSNGMNGGRRSGRNGGQDSNVFQWVDPYEQTQTFTAANDRKGKKATGAGTESTSTRSTFAFSGLGLSTTPPLDLTSHTPLLDVSTGTHNFFAIPSITLSLDLQRADCSGYGDD
jgi:hypothetical protein